jgi:molecular chaperone HscB
MDMDKDNIIDLAATGTQQGFHCWGCHTAVSVRALFCNNCGSIQPAREMDHFQRLGLEKRIDLDTEVLTRNFNQLQRTFSAERFIIRGQSEKNHAAKHREAIREAFDTLHDPIRRSRYWIDLHDDGALAQAGLLPPIVSELQDEFSKAKETAQLDKLAQRTGQEIEFGIMKLLSSLRSREWKEANEILVALDSMEVLITQVREKRQSLTPHANK